MFISRSIRTAVVYNACGERMNGAISSIRTVAAAAVNVAYACYITSSPEEERATSFITRKSLQRVRPFVAETNARGEVQAVYRVETWGRC